MNLGPIILLYDPKDKFKYLISPKFKQCICMGEIAPRERYVKPAFIPIFSACVAKDGCDTEEDTKES